MSSYYSIVFCSKTWQTSSTYSVSYLISSLFQSLSTSCVKVSIAKSNGRKKFVHVHHKIIDSQISSIYRFNICNSYYYIHYHRDELSSIIAHNYGIVIVQNGFHSDENDAYVLPSSSDRLRIHHLSIYPGRIAFPVIHDARANLTDAFIPGSKTEWCVSNINIP